MYSQKVARFFGYRVHVMAQFLDHPDSGECGSGECSVCRGTWDVVAGQEGQAGSRAV